MDIDFVLVHKKRKNERVQYLAILIGNAWSITDVSNESKDTKDTGKEANYIRIFNNYCGIIVLLKKPKKLQYLSSPVVFVDACRVRYLCQWLKVYELIYLLNGELASGTLVTSSSSSSSLLKILIGTTQV